MPSRGNLDGAPDAAVGSSSLPRPALPRQQQESEGKKQADRTDALWAEMQSTLEEVELSAVNGMHVFGPEHSKALEGLRAAQIELAQAWARSEADDTVDADKESKGLSGGKGLTLGSEGKSVLDTMGSTVASASGRPGSSGAAAGAAVVAAERRGSKLEEETEQDILLARNRREANDKYFQRVNEGVLDVVAKLEEVANAMKAVEQESRDIWGETDSARTSYHE
jgi:septum formation topological specificity factor MinE